MLYVVAFFQISIIQKKKILCSKTRSEIGMDGKKDIDHSDRESIRRRDKKKKYLNLEHHSSFFFSILDNTSFSIGGLASKNHISFEFIIENENKR